MAGSETAGMVPGESSNPRKAVPRAVGSIWLRLASFYLLGSLMVTINVDPKDESIFGGTGQGESHDPFLNIEKSNRGQRYHQRIPLCYCISPV